MATTLEAELREETGKGAGRRLRATGRVPGILYGHNMEPLKLSVSGQDLIHLFHASGGASMVLDLKVDGATHLAIPREIQRDHIHGRYIHIDFLAVRRDGKVALGGDGQVTVGQTVMKSNAQKVRTLHGGKLLAGFAGAAAQQGLERRRRGSGLRR